MLLKISSAFEHSNLSHSRESFHQTGLVLALLCCRLFLWLLIVLSICEIVLVEGLRDPRLARFAGRTALEVLEDFPSARVPLEWLLQIVPRLQPRYFSIASSLPAHPGQVHILAALVDYQTPHKRHKRGVCSAWLSGLQPGASDARVSEWHHI